jgi:hypothetical protein
MTMVSSLDHYDGRVPMCWGSRWYAPFPILNTKQFLAGMLGQISHVGGEHISVDHHLVDQTSAATGCPGAPQSQSRT